MAQEEWTKVEGSEYEFWKPNIGEEIVGNVVEIKEGIYGKQHVLEVTGKDKLVMLPSHKQLQSLLKDIKEKEIIKVCLERQEPPKVRGENALNIYDVYKR